MMPKFFQNSFIQRNVARSKETVCRKEEKTISHVYPGIIFSYSSPMYMPTVL